MRKFWFSVNFVVTLTAMLVVSIGCPAHAAWRFTDTRVNYDPNYEYILRVYSWDGDEPELRSEDGYDYEGWVEDEWMPYGTWSYGPNLHFIPGTNEQSTVWGEVYNRYNQGSWIFNGNVQPEWVADE